jgi:catechol 2,3-dioxygenase-like lactoylglutathione lyase family enzyme
MLDHVSISVSDIAQAERFYDAVMAALDVMKVGSSETWIGYGYQRQNWWRQRVFRFLDAPTSDSLKGWLPPVTWTHSPRRN